ncbi:EAL domain-containing protein [Pseudoalteromonas prydzensis]|uniref:EAL domain-containing protein n=2 Tax=Pseudoalteromonas prydzensis TaxID=182141 RepID=UPI001CE40580|nr:EAL domain-containing protein [Pseudoalteromonas prydzensis]
MVKKQLNILFSVFAQSRYIISLREAFIALIPYFVSSALAILVLNLAVNFAILSPSDFLYSVIEHSSNIIFTLLPLMVALSVGFHLSKNLGNSAVVGSMLALVSFCAHSDFLTFTNGELAVNGEGASAYAVLVPTLTSYLLMLGYKLVPKHWLELPLISDFLKEKLSLIVPLIVPFSLAFFALYLIIPLIELSVQSVLLYVVPSSDDSSVAVQLFKRMIIVHSFWFFGVHGDNAYSMMFDQLFLQQDIVPGLLAKISIPFSLFNFCEIILFALPVFLNPMLLVPFILVPCFNFLISYFLLSSGVIDYQEVTISWMTPTIINGAMVGTDAIAPLYQVFLIICNACIYYPFLRLSSEKNNYQMAFNKLSSQLNVSERFVANSEQRFIKQQRAQNLSSAQLTTVLNTISNARLALYYQPQIDLSTGQVIGFEALLRLHNNDGSVSGPYFLDTLIMHKQTDIIDGWVIKQAARDLTQWRNVGFKANISINVNPDVLINTAMVEKICQLFVGFADQVKIEIVESSYLEQQIIVTQNINKLRAHNIETVLDDFGTGYSSLSMLTHFPVKHVKLDRQFLLQCQQDAGRILYQQVTELFAKLGFAVVAEGIETHAEEQWVKSLGSTTAQGWLYAPAMLRNEVISFTQTRNNANEV